MHAECPIKQGSYTYVIKTLSPHKLDESLLCVYEMDNRCKHQNLLQNISILKREKHEVL